MQTPKSNPPKTWPFKAASVPLGDNGGTPLEEADMPVTELEAAYSPMDFTGVEHGDAQTN